MKYTIKQYCKDEKTVMMIEYKTYTKITQGKISVKKEKNPTINFKFTAAFPIKN